MESYLRTWFWIHWNFEFVFEKMKRKWGPDTAVYIVHSTLMWEHSLNLTARPNFYIYFGSHDSEFNCYYYRSPFTGRNRKTLAVETALFCINVYQNELSFTETWTKLLNCDAFTALLLRNNNNKPSTVNVQTKKNKRTLIIM